MADHPHSGHPSLGPSVLVIGGGSEIARALLNRLVDGLDTVMLAGPHTEGLAQTRNELKARNPSISVMTMHLDLTDLDSIEETLHRIFANVGHLDTVIMAAGSLGDQPNDERDPAKVAHAITVNLTGPAMALTSCSEYLQAQGRGLVIVLSSVAGERVRRSNYIYGAAKAGLDGFALGLADRLGPKVRVVVVRPGFVIGSMTRSLPTPPLATRPQRVARDIVHGIDTKATIVWSPPIMRPIMALYRHLPRRVARRLPY
jgi:decaprenylphospho-beta-D-erythro-pentofuranosid-2-ulose 2-reductase